jgi:hypothetical protein
MKLLVLFFLSAVSEMAFKRRSWGIMLLSLGFWLTFFRLAIARAAALYVGVFAKADNQIVDLLHTIVVSPEVAIFTDFVALTGAILTLILLSGEVSPLKRQKQKALDKTID